MQMRDVSKIFLELGRNLEWTSAKGKIIKGKEDIRNYQDRYKQLGLPQP